VMVTMDAAMAPVTASGRAGPRTGGGAERSGRAPASGRVDAVTCSS
jgi:hypothetical protein